MRRLLKFLHTMGAIGMMGSMAALIVLISAAPPPSSLAGYALVHGAMGNISRWIFLPSLVLTLAPGLLAFGANRGFHDAGWALAKLATGISVFEGSLIYIDGPIRQEARLSADALAGQFDPAGLAGSAGAQQGTLWVLLLVAAANVALGVWRPRFRRARRV